MLSETHILALKLHNIFFCYMPVYPIKWNSTFTGLELTKPFTRWIPYVFLMAWILFTGICCDYAGFTFYFLKPQKDFTIFHCLILTFGAIFFYVICAGSYYFLARIKTLLYGYKNILAVENALIKIYYRKLTASQKFELSRDDSRTAKFLVLVNIVCAGAPFLGLFVILVIDFDVFEVLFEA